MTLLCIVPGPTEVLRRIPDRVRWCFGCRAHLKHELVVLGDRTPSYYDPVAVLHCSGCGRDRTRFGS